MRNQSVCWFLYGRGPQPLVRSPVPVGPKLEAGALGVLNQFTTSSPCSLDCVYAVSLVVGGNCMHTQRWTAHAQFAVQLGQRGHAQPRLPLKKEKLRRCSPALGCACAVHPYCADAPA